LQTFLVGMRLPVTTSTLHSRPSLSFTLRPSDPTVPGLAVMVLTWA
jgi:hypothetical protein